MGTCKYYSECRREKTGEGKVKQIKWFVVRSEDGLVEVALTEFRFEVYVRPTTEHSFHQFSDANSLRDGLRAIKSAKLTRGDRAKLLRRKEWTRPSPLLDVTHLGIV